VGEKAVDERGQRTARCEAKGQQVERDRGLKKGKVEREVGKRTSEKGGQVEWRRKWWEHAAGEEGRGLVRGENRGEGGKAIGK
jgi:hypothetical protein